MIVLPDLSNPEPFRALRARIRDERLGPAGPASFVCWLPPVRYEWLIQAVRCVRCGWAIGPEPHEC